ncbi:class IV adenylate cyclase [Methanimicrococcus blatticola]|uniref:Adenylate cyclase n=1 Tax=Methanimicrococcus blatticola TaxID=91560 RepID=A0A484F5R0_9EURY|nr:class IV adenylate cyclase [Methanimicrococcus blatticola]MBZ3935028.1 class IV adenylate cyclase [Methanimicrococcus blatticola]MCC2508875.1 class IV adenylate cyclase [Methanimicrococcus blatticola]TDQ71099.1 adenylate cyclase [Methanimicrococcus blatticola]
MYEVEVKIKVPHAEIKKDLIECGAVFSGTEEQKDTYFNSHERDFSKTDEALRIRSVNGEGEITYKGKKIDTISKTRPEYNSPVDAGEMKEILLALGYFVSGAVNKRREIYTWNDFIIGFDSVEGLGEFVEVESNLRDAADKTEIKNEIDRIFEFLGKYGLSEKDSITDSYLEMVLKAEGLI